MPGGNIGCGDGRGPETDCFVVPTVSVAVTAADPFGVTEAGEKEQVTPWGKGVKQPRLTA